MEAKTTPKPPYIFPRQKPTAESVDGDGDILLRDPVDCQGVGFLWRKPDTLQNGDVWVPACKKFFKDWSSENERASSYMGIADRKWGHTQVPGQRVKP